MPGLIRPRTPEAATWFDRVCNQPLPVASSGERLRVEVPQATFAIGGLRVSVGAGGLHSVDRARVYYSNRKHRLVSVDVASFYPSLIATRAIAPRAYGDTGATIYQSILDRRLAIKQQARAAQDAAERERLEVQANALKLVLNSAFGKYGDPFSTLFDPGALLAVTLSGQLLLIDLIERLNRVGARVVSANTDGLFIRAPRRGRRWRKVLARWQRDTQMTLEIEPLRRLAILATNRFAYIDAKGKVKRKGDGLKGSLSPLAAPNSLIVNDAVAAARLQDVPPERTIWQSRDPVRFCRVTRRSGKVVEGVLLDEKTREETELPRVARWYRSRDSTRRIVHRLQGGRHTTPANAIGIALAQDLVDSQLPNDLDRGWYVAQARKVIQSVAGYRHRSRRRLQGNAAAARLLDLGLTPVPKWAGKAMLPGSHPKTPTLLWDWGRARTLGCYTGPRVSTLVLDIDDPVLFKKWIDRGNAPLLADRWRELEGCLASVRGGATAEHVRTGRARGKLIFRLAGDEDHPLAGLSINRWKKARGVEVFYGKGMPSILGEHPGGDHYRLEGGLTDAAAWLVDGLSPAKDRPKPCPGSNGQLGHPKHEPPANGQHGPSANGQSQPESREVDTTALEGLPEILAGIRPELGRASVGWRTKELADGRIILVGRCPYQHDSGTSSDTDLSVGFDEHGVPYVRCLHASCTVSREVGTPLAARYAREKWSEIEAPGIEPTDIARGILEDLAAPAVALHLAPTGSGKTYSLCQAAALRSRQGQATLIAVPTLRLAYEIRDRLAEIAPDVIRSEALAMVCGHRPVSAEDPDSEEGFDEGGEDETGAYPIHEWTRIIICTHAGIGRRGFSKFIRGIWTKLGSAGKGKDGRPAFAVIVDEASELVAQCRRDLDLEYRYRTRRSPDGSGGTLSPHRDCPRTNWSGNCSNCSMEPNGGEVRFNSYGIRELSPPRAIQYDAAGNRLRQPNMPLVVPEADLVLGPKVRVGTTTFAAAVAGFRGKPIEAAARRTAPLYFFTKDRQGRQHPETTEEILGHLLEFAFRPVVIWEHAVDAEGKPVASEALSERSRAGGRDWDRDITFPRQTCEVRRLRFADLALFEQLRRFGEQHQVGIVFAGATMTGDDTDVLLEVWPDLVRREHPYSPRKIRQAAVAFVEGRHGVGSLRDETNRLVTQPLEGFGTGLIFCPTRRLAESLFEDVNLSHPTAWLATENIKQMLLSSNLHRSAELACYITYSRGVMGLGANIENVRFVVIDALAFRAISGFNPGEITPEAFERARAQERMALILQNVGRALRGEANKTAVLIILNSDPELERAIRESRALVEGSEIPPIFARGKDLATLVDQSRRWLAAGGEEWPAAQPEATDPPRRGRPKGSTKWTAESIKREALVAAASGKSRREFCRKCHPERVVGSDELDTLKALFEEQPDDSFEDLEETCLMSGARG